MERAKDFEKFLAEMMSTEAADLQVPHPSLVFEAREKILSRKKAVKEKSNFIEMLVSFLRLDFKFYHVGLSLLIICAGVFCINEPNYSTGGDSAFMQYHESLSITNTTISVNSSTMLTSIPTLVIRN